MALWDGFELEGAVKVSGTGTVGKAGKGEGQGRLKEVLEMYDCKTPEREMARVDSDDGVEALEEDRPFLPGCTCGWGRQQETDGWIYYRTVPARRCPEHGKPRWPKKEEQ